MVTNQREVMNGLMKMKTKTYSSLYNNNNISVKMKYTILII